MPFVVQPRAFKHTLVGVVFRPCSMFTMVLKLTLVDNLIGRGQFTFAVAFVLNEGTHVGDPQNIGRGTLAMVLALKKITRVGSTGFKRFGAGTSNFTVLKIAGQGGAGHREGTMAVLDSAHPVPRVFESVAGAVLIGTVAMAPQFGVQVAGVHVVVVLVVCGLLAGEALGLVAAVTNLSSI